MDDAPARVGETRMSIPASSASVGLAKPHLAGAVAEVEQQMLAMLRGDRFDGLAQLDLDKVDPTAGWVEGTTTVQSGPYESRGERSAPAGLVVRVARSHGTPDADEAGCERGSAFRVAGENGVRTELLRIAVIPRSSLLAPSVAASLVRPVDLAGYRDAPVFIQPSMHVAPSPPAVRDAMPARFELLRKDPIRRCAPCSATSCSSTSIPARTATVASAGS